MLTQQPRITPKVSIDQTSDYKGTLKLGPVPEGCGHTVANPIRRTLLSRLEGYAIVAVKLPDGVLHEFDVIPGVLQDFREITLNLKKIRFKKKNNTSQEKITLHIKNKTILKAGDITPVSSNFEVLNPDVTICTMDESADFLLEFKVEKGCGYVPAEERETTAKIARNIPIDTIFTPIKNVSYKIENTLIGQGPNYEKIIMEIETDGSITVKEALQQASAQLIGYFSLLTDNQAFLKKEEPPKKVALDHKRLLIIKALRTPLADLHFSVRTNNCLRSIGVKTLGDIVAKTWAEIIQIRSLGKVSVQEINALVIKKGFTLGMDISQYTDAENTL